VGRRPQPQQHVGTIHEDYDGASRNCTSDVFAGPFPKSEAEIRNEHWVVDTFSEPAGRDRRRVLPELRERGSVRGDGVLGRQLRPARGGAGVRAGHHRAGGRHRVQRLTVDAAADPLPVQLAWRSGGHPLHDRRLDADACLADVREPGRQDEYVRDIRNSGRHLLELINEILDLSKVEAGQMVLDLDGVSLPDLLEYGVAMVRERAAS
jgi:signal transduction histidine kinase